MAASPPPGKRQHGPLQVISGHIPLWQPIATPSPANAWIHGRKSLPSSDAPSAPSSAGKRNEDYPSTASREAAAAVCSPTATSWPNGSRGKARNWKPTRLHPVRLNPVRLHPTRLMESKLDCSTSRLLCQTWEPLTRQDPRPKQDWPLG